MKLNKLKYLGLLVFGVYFGTTQAQQDPTFTMYQFNMSIVNPAFAGSTESIEATAMVRSQWAGLEGAPSTQTLSFSGPELIGKNMGIGMSIVNDKFNVVNETDIYVDFSYKLQLDETKDLYLGLKAGGSFFSADLLSLDINNDDAFSNNVSRFNSNFGAGAYLKGKNYYVSLSMPVLLKSKRYEKEGAVVMNASDKPHLYFSSGYTFDLGGAYNIKLTPSFMMRHVSGVPTSFDLTTVANMMEKFDVGVSHRFSESFSLFGLFSFYEKYKIGYAYEHTTSEFSSYARGTHEFVLKVFF